MSISQLEKGGYPHFMLKEIYEQPKTIVDCIRGRISPDHVRGEAVGVDRQPGKFPEPAASSFVACGTSWHAALIGEHLIESICRIPVEVEYASEFRYRNPVINADDIVIAVSQSGETADTLAAVELARKAGAFVFGICNVVGSSIARADRLGGIHPCGARDRRGFDQGLHGAGDRHGDAGAGRRPRKGHRDGRVLPRSGEGTCWNCPPCWKTCSGWATRSPTSRRYLPMPHNFIYLGRGYNYPTALEGALKLKEISYIHAEGYPAAEMKHGAIALIDNEMPTVAIATPDNTYEKTASNIEEIRARGGKIIAVIARDDTHVRRSADYTIEVPVVTDCLMPIVVLGAVAAAGILHRRQQGPQRRPAAAAGRRCGPC